MKKTILLLLFTLALLFIFGPREATTFSVDFDPNSLEDDLDAYLAKTEAQYEDIKPNLQKEIIWAGAKGVKTEKALIYVHGFSASRKETYPLSDQVAMELGANLFYTRLSGHGRGEKAMSEPDLSLWINDLAEALAIGERIGEKTYVITTSNGAPLLLLALSRPELKDKVSAIVMISPNLKINNPAAFLLDMPWARTVLPQILGKTYSFEARNKLHEEGWTTQYPLVATLPMAAGLKAVRGLDLNAFTQALLVIASSKDTVSDQIYAKERLQSWGGGLTYHEHEPSDGDDVNAHVLAGDAISPNSTEPLSRLIREFITAN